MSLVWELEKNNFGWWDTGRVQNMWVTLKERQGTLHECPSGLTRGPLRRSAMDCPSHGPSTVKMFHNQGSPTSHRLSTGRSTLHASYSPGPRDITKWRILMLVMLVMLMMVMRALSSQQVLQTARVSVSTSSRFNTSSTWWLLNHRVCRSCKNCNVYRLYTNHCNVKNNELLLSIFYYMWASLSSQQSFLVYHLMQ